MLSTFSRVLNDSPRNVRSKIINLYAFLITVNILVWILALIIFHNNPKSLAVSAVAYGFGLRHAVDADHIAVIDNVTRKLMQENKRPVGVGLFFSLGHSTIVIAMSVAIAITASTIQKDFPQYEKIGGIVGTLISAFFLFLIAVINTFVLWDVFKTFQTVKRGGMYSDHTLDETLNKRGLIGRFFRPLLRIVDSSWKMFPIGVLFGLGFDTATEVGLLGIAAASASHGMPIWDILLFPALFTCGMSLIDTTDGILMLGAYGWAFIKPIRKLYYNLTITLISVLVALFIGGIETLGVLVDQLGLKGAFWDLIDKLNSDENFGLIGYTIIGIFILSWIISTIIYSVKKYDDVEVISVSVNNEETRRDED
jgi:high-affinity nickel-transport protein